MRTTAFLRRALVSPQTPCASAATGMQAVNRILGRTNQGATCAQSFGDIVAKNASGKATVYAHLGRAMVFLNRGEDKLAAFDVENAAKLPEASSATKLIASLRFQCAVRILTEEQRKLTISGATTELEVSNKIQEVAKALAAMSEAVGTDYSVSIAAGEFYLYFANDAAAAATHFETAMRLAKNAGKVSVAAAGTAAAEAVASADIDISTLEMPSGLKSKNIDAQTLTADEASLASLRATFGEQLSAEQLTLLGSVLACETRGGAIFDSVMTPSENYGAWKSAKAASVRRRMTQFCHPLVEDHTVAVAKPARAFYVEGVSMEAAAKACPKDTHILDHLPGVPSTAVSADDKAFFEAFNALNAASTDNVPVDQAMAAKYYSDLATDLMAQVQSRAKVGLAEAFTALGKTNEAVKLINDVEAADQYSDMWRLFAAKGQLMKKLGKVEEADSAFKSLHALRVQKPGMDLPLMDENRYKSAFQDEGERR